MSTLSLFQKQAPQATSSVRYQPQQSAPLTQVGLSLVTSPHCCFVCVCVCVFHCVFHDCFRGVDSSTSLHWHRMGWLFSQRCERKNKLNRSRLRDLDLNDYLRFEWIWSHLFYTFTYAAALHCHGIMSLLPAEPSVCPCKMGPVASLIEIPLYISLRMLP